ncbi:unnamed protein product [Jaminaea pallidilutea]
MARSTRPLENFKQTRKDKSHARRQAAAGPSKPRSIQDVYDFAVGQDAAKSQRSRLGRRQEMTGSESEEESGSGRLPQRRGARGNSGQDNKSLFDHSSDHLEATHIDSQDDSDIDSDEAFGDSDADEYAGYAFGTNRDRPEKEQSDSADSRGSDGDDGLVDLSTMLDGSAAAQTSTSDGNDDGDSTDYENSVKDGNSEGQLKRLAESYALPQDPESNTLVPAHALDGNKRRRVLADRRETMPESEFAAASQTSSSGPALLGINDLLAPIDGGSNANLASLRSSSRALGQSGDRRQPVASRRGGGALSAPLPDVVQDRLQRSAGYALSQEEAEKWQSTIKRVREAEHLSFPLQEVESRAKPSTAQMSSTYQASNALEDDVSHLLHEAGLSEKQIAQHEELAMRRTSPEEAARRRDELRKMRELMFRAEQKAKRINKIKSKAFRKVARKDKHRQEEKLSLMGAEGEGDEDAESARHRWDVQRAKERATLKHKNNSKWGMSAHTSNDDFQSGLPINEDLERSEALRRRMQGQGDEASSEEESDDGSQDDTVRRALDKLQTIDYTEEKDKHPSGIKKGVWDMKFMQDARKRDDAVTNAARCGLERDLHALADEGSADETELEVDATEIIRPSRRKFGAASEQLSQSNNGDLQNKVGEKVDSSEQSTGAFAGIRGASPEQSAVLAAHLTDSDKSHGGNPWLAPASNTRKAGESRTDQTSIASPKNDGQCRSLTSDRDVSDKIRDRARSNVNQGPAPSIRQKRAGPSRQITRARDNTDESGSLDEAPLELYSQGRSADKSAFAQRDLISEAFAGDDVAADFAAEKHRVAQADAPQKSDSTLPGWGSWGGKGIKTNRKNGSAKRSEAQLRAADPGLDPSRRRDAQMSNVLINERRDKKAGKYSVKDLPHPYTSARQYNAQREQPLGPEWNTLTQTQRLTTPRVLAVKPGSVIRPIHRT